MASFPGGVISGNIIPSATGQDLGSSGARWDGNVQTLDVAGTSTLTGAVTCASTLAVSGTLTSVAHNVTGNLAITGNETVSGTLGVTGATSLTSVVTTGNETVGGNLAVTGTTTLTGATTATGAITANGGVLGAVNGVIGGTTPAAGTFTTLISTGGAINGTIGATTPAAATFTTSTATTAQVISATNSESWTRGYISELITLSTSGATTDSVANLLPANSIIEAVVARVTTTITTATDWKLGDATIAGRFSAVNAVMTSGSTQVGTVHVDQTGTSGPRQTAAAKLRITTTGTPGAGVIRVTVFYRQFVAPSS